MISLLQGILAKKTPTELIIDVHGVGYAVNIPLSTYEKLQHSEGTVKIFTHLHVREDAMTLYGFATEAERDMFLLLISVSGIGPKMAQSVLSGLALDELAQAIAQSNVTALTSISGVGRKTAERLIMELRDKVTKIEHTEKQLVPSSGQAKVRAEVIVALMSLGHSRANAEQALRAVLMHSEDKDLSVEELIKASLRHTSK